MNRREHLLSCLAEECAEIAQRVSKALRFGLDEIQPGQPFTNAERIAEELLDLGTIVHMLEQEGVHLNSVSPEYFRGKRTVKIAKVEKFMAYAREQGALKEDVA